MTRQAIDGGTWFDIDEATRFFEDTYHDGSNMISRATGSQWEHETLYRTAKGSWVLRHWSNWQGTTDKYATITAHEATTWMLRNGIDPDEHGLGDAAAALEM